jgi:hypothetical protein
LIVSLYRELMEQRAFFVIRERHNLRYRALAVLDLSLETLSTLAWLTRCRDEIIQLTRDEAKTVLRLVSFQCGTHRFHLVTNRVELTTAQVIRLYSWRGPRGVALSRVATHCRSLTPDQLE